ncbi:hypothetical protein NP233_g4813 [Leucocoprinus birnbaumii]|uniref:Nephrocystin 3-like N-terminal domain-containing protein n=1 Tax=Leucocoprinus birnbaumii TaxID=56174 RepID=A0AAD5W0F3_9AGAR|nr:hypothetical protein NP233_g4813 [Leucocoprinus birnbaumii]
MKSDYSRFFHVTVLPISREADEDIELYLQNGLKNVLRRRNILLSYPWPSKRDIEALVNAAAGLFIYPATIIRFVDQTGRAPEELLNLVLGALGASSDYRSIGSNGATIQPFAELDAFYMLIMRRIPENLLPSVQLLLTLAITTPFESCTWSAIGLSNMLGFSESQFRLVCNELHAVLHFQEADALGAHPDLPCTKLIHSTTLSDIPHSGNAWLRQVVSRLGGVLTFYHKSFYDFLSDPIRSGTFCVSTSHLVHAYDGPSNVLSWPAHVTLIDSYIKVVTFNNAGFTLLHALHPYNQLDPQIVGLLADFDFRKHLLSQCYVFSGALVSRSINLGFPSLAKYVHGASISTMLCRIPPSFFHAFDGQLFRESVRQLEKHGVIRKMHSSDLMTRLRKNSGKSRGKVTSGLYKKGYGSRKTYWYWEPTQIMNLNQAHGFIMHQPQFIYLQTDGHRGIDILLQASLPEATHDSVHRHPAPSCFPGTRQQHIEDITQWVDHRRDDTRQLPPIYCMTGPAGVGKSAIAQTCAEHLQRLNMLGAAFFFSVNGRDDHTRFFPSLAYQLSTTLPESYRDLLNQMILKDKTLVYKKLDSQFQKLIVEPLSGLNLLNHTVSRKAILICGLDECKSKDVQCEIIKIIAASVKNGDTPFCWAFFSRPEAHIKATFENPDINKFTSFAFLPISCGIDAEIEVYLKGAFENLVRRHNLHVSRPWPSTAQLKTLVEAASGLFVYAATLLRFIEQFTLDPNEPLNEVLELISKSSRNVKAGPPAGATAFYELDMFYKHVIGRIPKDALPSTLRFLAGFLLSPFGSAWQVVLLSNLLRLSKVKFWSICHILQPVLYCRMESHDDSQTSSGMTEDNGVLFMYHKSFYDFPDDPARSGDFCVSTTSFRTDLFDHLIRLHHELSGTYLIQNEKLVLAPLLPNSAVSLSWPTGAEEFDAFIKRWIFDHATSKLIYPHSLSDLPRQLVQKLPDVDYRKVFLAQAGMYTNGGYIVSLEVFRCNGIGRRINGTFFYCIPPSEFASFDVQGFHQMIELYTNLTIIQPYFPSSSSSVSSVSSLKGLYTFGHGSKRHFWYWEINQEDQCYYEFGTVDADVALSWHRNLKLDLTVFLSLAGDGIMVGPRGNFEEMRRNQLISLRMNDLSSS